MSASGWVLYLFGWAVVLMLVRVRKRSRRRSISTTSMPDVGHLFAPKRGVRSVR